MNNAANVEKCWARHSPRTRIWAKMPADLVMNILNVQKYWGPGSANSYRPVSGLEEPHKEVEVSTTLETAKTKQSTNKTISNRLPHGSKTQKEDY